MTEPIALILRAYLADNYLPHVGNMDLRDDDDLFDTGILDSAGALDLLFFVEERFGISVPDDDFVPENFASIAAASTYIGNRQAFEALQGQVSEGGG